MSKKAELQKEIELRLGGGMVDVELDPEHYELAINKSYKSIDSEVKMQLKKVLLLWNY